MSKNPFKEIETDKEAPAELKKSVFKELNSIQLIMDIGDLFFSKVPSVVKEVFKTKK